MPFIVSPEQAGKTIAALLRIHLAGSSWKQVHRVIAAGRVRIGNESCLDPSRRLRAGESIEILKSSRPRPDRNTSIVLRYLDSQLVVAEKPSGISTVRHPLERDWPQRRKALNPALEEILPRLIAINRGRPAKGALPRLRVVHRLDKATSGLIVFARTPMAERSLGRQFHQHTVERRYLAVIRGYLGPQKIESMLVRDRGDGRRR